MPASLSFLLITSQKCKWLMHEGDDAIYVLCIAAASYDMWFCKTNPAISTYLAIIRKNSERLCFFSIKARASRFLYNKVTCCRNTIIRTPRISVTSPLTPERIPDCLSWDGVSQVSRELGISIGIQNRLNRLFKGRYFNHGEAAIWIAFCWPPSMGPDCDNVIYYAPWKKTILPHGNVIVLRTKSRSSRNPHFHAYHDSYMIRTQWILVLTCMFVAQHFKPPFVLKHCHAYTTWLGPSEGRDSKKADTLRWNIKSLIVHNY